MNGLWILAVGVLVLDVLIARQLVVEWRRYRLRRSMQRLKSDIEEFARVVGKVLLPTMRNLVAVTAAFAKALDG